MELQWIWECVKDALLDTAKLIPFLFATYLAMEWLEHKTGTKAQAVIRRAGRLGPILGGALGIVPQCGFSAAASNLYSGGLITAGTLAAVFLSTSDEMLPIFLSESVPFVTIVKVLVVKMILGIVSGFLLDFLYHNIIRKEIRYKNIHSLCESEHCKCEEGIAASALRHTVQIVLFIYIITLALNLLIDGIGIGHISGLVLNRPVIGELIAGIIGLIPNCAASVVITELYLQGVIGTGPMLTGLLAGAGVGMLLLCRMNKKHPKQTMGIISFVYVSSVCWGILFDLAGVTF